MASVYSVQTEPGRNRYFAGKKEALTWGRNLSVQVDHIIPVYECDLLPGTTRLEGIVHALNGTMILSTTSVTAFRKGRTVKGWGDASTKKTAEKLGKIRSDLGETS